MEQLGLGEQAVDDLHRQRGCGGVDPIPAGVSDQVKQTGHPKELGAGLVQDRADNRVAALELLSPALVSLEPRDVDVPSLLGQVVGLRL